MSLVSIGPVGVFHGNPEFSWDSSPTSRAGRRATIGGLTDWPEAQTLSELVANPAEQRTIGDATGVLEWVAFDDALLEPFTGWYLLSSFSLNPDQRSSVGGAPVKFSLSAVFLGPAA